MEAENENEGWGDLRGLQTTVECAATGAPAWDKASLGRRGVESPEKRVESIRRQHWQWLDEQLDRPFPLPWLPLNWAESEPEEDTVQTLRADALKQMDHYL